jgi:hypothetical protein
LDSVILLKKDSVVPTIAARHGGTYPAVGQAVRRNALKLIDHGNGSGKRLNSMMTPRQMTGLDDLERAAAHGGGLKPEKTGHNTIVACKPPARGHIMGSRNR